MLQLHTSQVDVLLIQYTHTPYIAQYKTDTFLFIYLRRSRASQRTETGNPRGNPPTERNLRRDRELRPDTRAGGGDV